MFSSNELKDAKTMLLLAGLPLEIVGEDIVFEGQALDPSMSPCRMNLGKVESFRQRAVQIEMKYYYYLILTTGRGKEYTYCGFGDFWHFEQDGKIFVGKIKVQDGKEAGNG